jgi:hypothetical protein
MTADQSGAPLRFATFLAPNMLPVYRFLADQIAHRLGCPVQLVVGSSFDQFDQGEADLGVICGLPYVWLADRRPPPVEPLAAPVLAGDRYAGRPIYYSDVIVRHDSPITRLEELEGRSWAYNEPASHSGHTVTLYSLVAMGARIAENVSFYILTAFTTAYLTKALGLDPSFALNALLIASARAIKEHGLKPLARITGLATAGVEPRIMGIGPVPAVRKLLAENAKKAGVKSVVFDRGGYLYHGRVKALADGAREGGLEF